MRKAKTNVVNQDNESLHAYGNHRFIIGYVEKVNGSGAEEIPDFVPTRHELLVLAKYWTQERLEQEFWCFCTQSSGSTEWRLSIYAGRRIDRIADLIAEEEVDCAENDAIAELGRKYGDSIFWSTFLDGGRLEDIADMTVRSPDEFASRAGIREILGRLDDAIDDLDQAIRIEPRNNELYEYRARLQKMNEYELSGQDLGNGRVGDDDFGTVENSSE